MNMWDKVASSVGLKVAGVLGRPLYVCTQQKSNGRPCMAVAAMSPLMESATAHNHFVCANCKRERADAPVSDSAPLRVLRLYILVHIDHGNMTVMRSASFRIIIKALRDQIRWGRVSASAILEDLTMVHPKCELRSERLDFLSYNDEESQAIWEDAQSYQDRTCVV
jgi:hypothetical protein